MTRYEKKNQSDSFDGLKQQRLQRRIRGHKFATSSDKFEKRHSWGYSKRRSLVTD